MKKWIAFILVILCASGAMAESVDLSALTVDELQLLRERITEELESRDPATILLEAGKKKVLLDKDGFKVYLTGQYKTTWKNEGFYISVAFENNSDQKYSVWAENVKLNGWSLPSSIMAGSTAPGEKKITEMYFSPGAAMVTELREMEEMVFDIGFSNENYQTVKEYGPYKMTFDFEKKE